MRDIVSEMKSLKESTEAIREQSLGGDVNNHHRITTSRKRLEDLEKKLNVVEKDLDRTRSDFHNYEDNEDDERNSDIINQEAMDLENAAIETMSGCGPVTRTLLWDILEFTTKTEVTKFELREKLQRKEASLSSLQDEIDYLNHRIGLLKKTTSTPQRGGRPAFTEISNLNDSY